MCPKQRRVWTLVAGYQQLRCETSRSGTDASTLINTQKANFPVMEETPTQLGSDGCQRTNNAQIHKHTLTITFHVHRLVLRYIQIYS